MCKTYQLALMVEQSSVIAWFRFLNPGSAYFYTWSALMTIQIVLAERVIAPQRSLSDRHSWLSWLTTSPLISERTSPLVSERTTLLISERTSPLTNFRAHLPADLRAHLPADL